jgi:hypothetical protein
MSAPPAAPEQDRRNPFTTTRFILSALVILLVAALGVVLAFRDPDPVVPDTQPSFSTPGDSVGQPQQTDAWTDQPTGCPATVESDVVPTTPPPATWAPRGRVDAPSSPEHGPLMGRCYSHSPTGAVFAAANFLAATTDPAGVEAAIRDLTAAGSGQEALLAILEENPALVVGTGAGYDIRAFAVLSYTPDVAAVVVAVRTGDRSLGVVPIGLTWAEGTWLVQLPDDGDLPANGVDQLDEFYVPWTS